MKWLKRRRNAQNEAALIASAVAAALANSGPGLTDGQRQTIRDAVRRSSR